MEIVFDQVTASLDEPEPRTPAAASQPPAADDAVDDPSAQLRLRAELQHLERRLARVRAT